MAYKVIISDSASKDIDEGIEWYQKIDSSLATRFVYEVYQGLELITNNPEIFRNRYKELKLLNLNKFPYQVIYRINNYSVVEVVAVLHSKRNPKHWKKRGKT